MRHKFRVIAIIWVLAALVMPLSAHAVVVGRFTLVRGQVDVLRGGKLPAVAAKVQDGVERGDVIRTKSGAKAQLSMVDASVITLAPESRLALADYRYDPAREERRAVLRLFRGLVHTVVNRIIKTEEPDFFMETHTATLGVRGTNWYTLLGPNSTGVYLPRGILALSSNLPSVSGSLQLLSGQFSQIQQGLPPSAAQALTPEIMKMLEKLMDTGLSEGGLGVGAAAPGAGSLYKTPLTLPGGLDQKLLQQTIPPVLTPQHQVPVQPAPTPAPAPVHPSVSPGPSPGM